METKPLTVAQTIAAMMRAYPLLFPTRADALMNLFRSYDSEWVNGHLVASVHVMGRDLRSTMTARSSSREACGGSWTGTS